MMLPNLANPFYPMYTISSRGLVEHNASLEAEQVECKKSLGTVSKYSAFHYLSLFQPHKAPHGLPFTGLT